MQTPQYEKIHRLKYRSVYPLYVQKATKKGRSQEEVDTVIRWLTGYDDEALRKHLASDIDFAGFFAQAPQIHPNASKITGVICGVRVEDITDGIAQKTRYLDKLIDELAKGKPLQKILRQ